MMKLTTRKTLLAAAVAFATTSGSVMAATQFVNTTKNLPSGVNMSATDLNLTEHTTTGAVGAILLTLQAGDDFAIGDVVTVDLTGGTFTGAPKLVASATGTTGATITTPSFTLISGGTAGSSQAVFKAGVAWQPNAGDTLVLTNAAGTGVGLIKMASNTAGSKLNIKTTITVSTALGSTVAYNTPLTQKNPHLAVVPMATLAAGAKNTGTIAVSDAFKLFTAGTGTTLVTVGTLPAGAKGQDAIKSTNPGLTLTVNPAAAAGKVTTNVPATAPAAGKFLLTLGLASGESINGIKLISDAGGATTITASDATGSTTAVTGTNIGTNGQFYIDAATNKAYAVLQATGANISLQIQSAQTTPLTNLTANVTAQYLGDTNYAAQSIPGGGVEMALTRNGTAFVANSVGPLNILRVTDRSGNLSASGADGTVTLTTYTKAGVKCTAVPAVTVPSNGSVDILGSAIQQACPGTYRVEGVVNSTAIEATNVKNTAGGVSVSPVVVNTGGTGGI